MSTKAKKSSVDVGSAFESAASQFRGLNPKEPGQWPTLPKAASWLAMVAAVVVACWFALLSTASDELQAERDREPANARKGRAEAKKAEQALAREQQREEKRLRREAEKSQNLKSAQVDMDSLALAAIPA